VVPAIDHWPPAHRMREGIPIWARLLHRLTSVTSSWCRYSASTGSQSPDWRKDLGNHKYAPGSKAGGSSPRHDPTAADLLRDQAYPVPVVTWCPRLHATGLGTFDQLGPVLARHFLGEAAHEHAPACTVPKLDVRVMTWGFTHST
jgi:hypothetical protein